MAATSHYSFVALYLMLLHTSAAVAQDEAEVLPQPPTALSPTSDDLSIDNDWRFTIAFPMIWAPSVSAKIKTDTNPPITIDIPFSSILDRLSVGFIGDFYARKGPWQVMLSLNYLGIEDDLFYEGGILLPDISADIDLVLSSNDLMGGYWFTENWMIYSGVRYVFVNVEAQGTIGGTPTSKLTLLEEDIFDYQLGFGYSEKLFNQRWFVAFNADTMIAGDNDRNYLLNTKFGYSISELNNLWIGWRYFVIGVDSETDGISSETDFVQSGPTLGWAFTF
jgi:hypothetical protein